MTAVRVNLKTEKVVEKPAREIVIGDRAKLGGRWHRVASVYHFKPATDDEVEQAFLALTAAHDRLNSSEPEFYECARDLAGALGGRQRSPEPYVEIKGGSATTYWEKRYAANEIVKVIVPRDEPVTVDQAIRENLVND